MTMQGKRHSEEAKARIARKVSAAWTPERRAAHSARMKERYADPERRAQQARSWTPEMRAAQSERIKGYFENPAWRDKFAAAVKEGKAKPEKVVL